MATLKLRYDGWLALPADLRRQLGLSSGDRLEAELAQGAIVLRPAAKGRRPERQGEGGKGEDHAARQRSPLRPGLAHWRFLPARRPFGRRPIH